MAAMGYDDWGRPIVIPAANPGRYRPRQRTDYQTSHQQIYQDDAGQFYTPEASGGRHSRPAPPSGGMRPAQIIINNENNIVDDGPPVEFINRPQVAQPPQRVYVQQPQVIQQAPRVYVQEQQVVQVGQGRSPADLSYETRRALEDLEKLKRDKEEEALVKRVEKDLQIKAAKKKADELQRIEDDKEMKKKAIEEWKAEQAKAEREKKEKEAEREKIGQEYMRQQLRREGWTEAEIEQAMKKQDQSNAGSSSVVSTSIIVSNKVGKRPTFVKVHKKHIAPETLIAYKLEWEWDPEDENYIIIYKSLSEADQDILFEHTRKLKETKLIKFAEVETTVVKKVDRDRHGRLVVVRKKDRERSKSPGVKKTFWLG